MSTSFSANQYQDAFYSKKLQNWEKPATHTERPKSKTGGTPIIATDRGHLLNGVPKSGVNPWGDFVGTWDLPKNIPGNCTRVPTARTTYARERLERDTEQASRVLTGQAKNNNRRAKRGESPMTTYQRAPAAAAAPEQRVGSASKADYNGYRSGAMAPSPLPAKSATPQPYTYNRTPEPYYPQYTVGDTVTSPIPGVPDMREVLVATPQLPDITSNSYPGNEDILAL